MNRRRLFAVLLLGARGAFAQSSASLRGTLAKAHTLITPQTIFLGGDEPTVKVLDDERLFGADFELLGHPTAVGRFEVDPIHERAMFVHKDGKRLTITYWCDVCYIRTYSPGSCWCCQRYTELDLRESDN